MTAEERQREREHVIIEGVLTDRDHTIRCKCGRSATFARERKMGYGGEMTVEPARSLAEFVCLKDSIVLRKQIIAAVK